jgi:hypothetical protein
LFVAMDQEATATRPGEPTWTGNESAFLPSTARLPKPWERKPQSPFKRRPGTKAKVWKRYDSAHHLQAHSYPSSTAQPTQTATTTTSTLQDLNPNTTASPVRIVKKQRTVASSRVASGQQENAEGIPPSFTGTFWDRRSSLPRRMWSFLF